MAEKKLRFQSEDRGERGGGGGGDHSTGGRDRVVRDARAGAHPRDDQWVSISLVADAMRQRPHDAGEQDAMSGSGRASREMSSTW